MTLLQTPEIKAIVENETRYYLASAAKKMERDSMIATWRDVLHSAMLTMDGSGTQMIHAVMDSMDRVLKRSKEDR